MLSLGSYLLGAAQVAAVALLLGFSAYRLRRRLLPAWEGAPARLVEAVVAVALLIWLGEVLGTFGLFYAGTLIGAAALVAVTAALWPAGSHIADAPAARDRFQVSPRQSGDKSGNEPAGENVWSLLVMVGVMALVVGHWALTTKHALDAGVFNFDSLWYHLPFAAEMVQSHSTTGMHHVDTVFANWFYPQNSELLHGTGMLLTGRDMLSIFLNYGWLALAFLAAWCIGRPYGRGSLSVVAAAILLEAHVLVVREPGAAKNDLMAAALLLAAIAILVTAWNSHRSSAADGRSGGPDDRAVPLGRGGAQRNRAMALPVGWALAAAGLAVGLAAGTKVTVLAMAAALTVAVLVLAPQGRRWAAAGWWFVPALLGGGYWYLRNLVVAGNPLPAVESLGPISLPHPDRLQVGRPDFSIAHYATDTGVWSEYFAPGLHSGFGALWPLVFGIAIGAALLALFRGRGRSIRAAGAVALFGFLAYLVTPLSAAGADGAPEAFGINVRYVYAALLAGLVLAPLPPWLDTGKRRWWLLGALLVVLALGDRGDIVLRDPSRPFALLLATLAVLVPAALLLARGRGASRGIVAGGFAALALAVLAIGYPLQRHYFDQRFANEVAAESIPGMGLDSAYRWARGVEDARIGLAGSTASFAQYGFFGPDLSNRVLTLGAEGPHGAFNAIPTCAGFRAAVNAADLDYLVTAPFLNFLHPGDPVASPEARWLRGEDAVRPVLRGRRVTVWQVEGQLDPGACGPDNAPLREIPDTPGS